MKVTKLKLFSIAAICLVLVALIYGESVFNNGKASSRYPASGGDRTVVIFGQTIHLNDLEEVPDGENAAIESTNNVFKAFFQKTYIDPGPQKYEPSGITLSGTRRGVHPKGHGCIRGKLTVSKDLSEHDQIGIFKTPGKAYDVIARFSNGSPRPLNDDSASDSRGFGLKVLGVAGEDLLKNAEGATDQTTQSFTMNSSDAFFADTAATYRRFMEITLNETPSFADAGKKALLEHFEHGEFLLGYRVFKAFKSIIGVHATNPLGIRYWSITPFQHGAGPHAPVVKYSLEPCSGVWNDPVDPNDTQFLRTNLKKKIEKESACFKFLVQDWNKKLWIEDPSRPWKESISPFRQIARVDFSPQNLLDDMECEKQVINIWNTLPEHQPVGGINRLRLGAYLMSIDARKKTNNY